MRVFLLRVLWAASLATALFSLQGVALAQLAEVTPPAELEFSNNAGSAQRALSPRLGRWASTSPHLASAPRSGSRTAPAGNSPVWADELVAPNPHLFEHFFLSGIACLVRGDPAGAAEVFEVTGQVAGELPQMAYLQALGRVLADFPHRERALATIRRAVASDGDHPLYAIVEILADAKQSVLKADGALYLTASAMRALRAAANRLPSTKDAYNGKYLASLLAAIAESGDAALPYRWAGFAPLLAPGRSIVLPEIAAPQALGRLFVLSISPEQLARYEARFLTGPAEDRQASAGAGTRVSAARDLAALP